MFSFTVCLLLRTIITLPAGAVAKYRNEYVGVFVSVCQCVSVCLSASMSPKRQARSLPNFVCMFPMAMARSFSGGVTKYQEKGAVLRVIFPLTMHCSGINFVTHDRFCLNLLIYRKVGQNLISYY